MYSTCLFCTSALGANDVIEHFPVGRRLAYDEATGRLWVVCGACERWNLSPLETRWEAIEEAERLFRSTKVRVVSDNIGLARLRDGTELVRIGKPPKIELAVWRYGDQFGKRQRRSLQAAGLYATAGVGALAMISAQVFWEGSITATGGAALSVGSMLLNLGGSVGNTVQTWRKQQKLRAAVYDDSGAAIHLSNATAREIAFATGGREFDWKLRVPRYVMRPTGAFGRMLGLQARLHYNNDSVYLSGDAAVRALANALPHVNSEGAGKRNVRDALNVVNEVSNIPQLLQRASTTKSKRRADEYMDDGLAPLGGLPAPMRLALEMALHEDDERRAMEGELHRLEQRWREADEIAKIADHLLLPPEIEEQLSSIRDKNSGSS